MLFVIKKYQLLAKIESIEPILIIAIESLMDTYIYLSLDWGLTSK